MIEKAIGSPSAFIYTVDLNMLTGGACSTCYGSYSRMKRNNTDKVIHWIASRDEEVLPLYCLGCKHLDCKKLAEANGKLALLRKLEGV